MKEIWNFAQKLKNVKTMKKSSDEKILILFLALVREKLI